MNGFDLSAFYGQFREETEENLRALTDGLLALEAQPSDRPALDGIFRAAHTIKGSARMLGQNEAGRLAHAMETVLGQLRSGALTMTPSLNDALLASADVLQALAARVGDPPPTDERVDPLITWLDGFDAGPSNMLPTPASPPAAAAPAAQPPAPAPADQPA
ncbi:MAG TPA: Hpt domain-containing protein, partial [Herpetosiphonaceae bacterium]